MADAVAPEFTRFIEAQRAAQQLPPAMAAVQPGAVAHPVALEEAQATTLMRVAARRASGLFRPSPRNEVVWVDGDNELAINLAELQARFAEGFIQVVIPVRCDQTGSGQVEVVFAVGADNQPAGLYAAAYRQPNGPALVVSTWGEALVAFAWQCVLGLVGGIAGALGKDTRGNVLVASEMVVGRGSIRIQAMGRHRFMGGSGLKPSAAAVPAVPRQRRTR